MSQKWVIDAAAEARVARPEHERVHGGTDDETDLLTSAYKKGLKTGMYYLRSQAKAKRSIRLEECESCGS